MLAQLKTHNTAPFTCACEQVYGLADMDWLDDAKEFRVKCSCGVIHYV